MNCTLVVPERGCFQSQTKRVRAMSTRTILIIEDSVSAVAGYMQVIETLNLDVIPLVAPTYEKAKVFLDAEPVDLVILDLMLPDALGTDVLEALRRRSPEVPILLVTGHPEELEWTKVKRFRLAGFFIKPFHAESFGEAVDSSLQRPDDRGRRSWAGGPLQ